jgi:hypothetical protein
VKISLPWEPLCFSESYEKINEKSKDPSPDSFEKNLLNSERNVVTWPNAYILFETISPTQQGCQMVCFQTKNPNLGTFWRVLHWKMLVYYMDTWSSVRFYGHFGIVRGNLVYFSPFWCFIHRKIWHTVEKNVGSACYRQVV